MCMSLLGRVVALDPEGALVQIGERTRRVATLLVPDVAIGDDVLVTGGLVFARLTPEEADFRRRMFERMLGGL